MKLLLKYVKALVNLYEIVHKDKVIEIFNQQNKKPIDRDTINQFMQKNKERLWQKEDIAVERDYFVSYAVKIENSLDEEIAARKGMPFYVPDKKELLRYAHPLYYEFNQEVEDLFIFLRKKLGCSNFKTADILMNIHSYFRRRRYVEEFHYYLNEIIPMFKSEEQFVEFMGLVMAMADSIRMADYNGYKPCEMNGVKFDPKRDLIIEDTKKLYEAFKM